MSPRAWRHLLLRVQVLPLPVPRSSEEDPVWRMRTSTAWACPRCRRRWPYRVSRCPGCDGACRPEAKT